MQKAHSKTETVTPAIAEDWLANATYERQRKMQPWQVKRLATEMEKGRFIEGVMIHFGVLDGKPKLVNGQHTLAAIAKSGIPIRLTILRTPVDNEDELGQLYGRHDRGRGRTPSDAFLGMNLSGKLELHTQEVNAFAPSLRWVLTRFRHPKVTGDIEIATSLDFLADEMEVWAGTARQYFGLVREANTGLKGAYRRMPVVAIGLATVHHQPVKAREFWLGAANDDSLTKHDPRHMLNAFLRQKTNSKGDPLTYMRTVAACWNRYFENGELQKLRPSGLGKIGITIKGTPFKAVDRFENGEPEDHGPVFSVASQGNLGIEASPS